MPKKMGNGGHGPENYDASTGQYVAGAGSNSSGQNNTKKSFLKKIDNSNANAKTNFLKKKTDGGTSQGEAKKIFEKIKAEKWWKSRNIITVDEFVNNVDKFFDKDVCDFVEKFGMHTRNTLGATNTSHAYMNTVLSNAIAQKQFHPLNVLSKDEFDKLKPKNVKTAEMPNQKLALAQRGFHNKDIINIYLGKQKSDCLLPNGMHGSSIYTAYNDFTAQSYASQYSSSGKPGYVMSFLVDNEKGNTISDTNFRRNQFQEMRMKLPEIKNKIIEKCKALGKDDKYGQTMAHIFESTLKHDETFGPLLLGYDAVYVPSREFCLILNWKNVYAREDW